MHEVWLKLFPAFLQIEQMCLNFKRLFCMCKLRTERNSYNREHSGCLLLFTSVCLALHDARWLHLRWSVCSATLYYCVWWQSVIPGCSPCSCGSNWGSNLIVWNNRIKTPLRSYLQGMKVQCSFVACLIFTSSLLASRCIWSCLYFFLFGQFDAQLQVRWKLSMAKITGKIPTDWRM